MIIDILIYIIFLLDSEYQLYVLNQGFISLSLQF